MMVMVTSYEKWSQPKGSSPIKLQVVPLSLNPSSENFFRFPFYELCDYAKEGLFVVSFSGKLIF